MVAKVLAGVHTHIHTDSLVNKNLGIIIDSSIMSMYIG